MYVGQDAEMVIQVALIVLHTNPTRAVAGHVRGSAQSARGGGLSRKKKSLGDKNGDLG